MRTTYLPIPVAILCVVFLSLNGCLSSRSRVPGVTVLPGRGDPRVSVEVYPNQVVLDIESPRGIGGSIVELSTKMRPKRLLLRFHLRGLEELRFTYNERTTVVALASTGSREVREQLHQGGAERTLAPGDAHWMTVRIGGSASTAAGPNDGVIDVEAPKEFLASGARRFTIEWVDYFR